MPLAIEGLNSTSDGGNTLRVDAGACRDATDTVDIVIPGGEHREVDVTVTGLGGVVGGVEPNTSYALYLVRQDSTGTVAAVLSKSFSASVPGFKARRIGAVLTNQASKVVPFTQIGSSNARRTTYDGNPPILIVVNGLGSPTFQDFDLGPPKPVTARLARLQVAPNGGPTTLTCEVALQPCVEIEITGPTTFGFTAPIGSDKGSFRTDGGGTTSIRVTGFAEDV